MVSNERVFEEQAKLALNDAYVAAHGPVRPIRQNVEPENVFSHPGLLREALESPSEQVEVVTTGNVMTQVPLTSEGGAAVVSTATNTAQVIEKAPKSATDELTDAQKAAQKDLTKSDVKKALTEAGDTGEIPDKTHR